MSNEWYQHNDIANKLRAALEAVIDGHGLAAIFDGLAEGKATVSVSYNGETCVFYRETPTLNKLKVATPETPLIVPVAEAQDTAELDEDPQIVAVPKRTRKPKIATETVPVGDGVKAEF
jgi:hypothetical protein